MRISYTYDFQGLKITKNDGEVTCPSDITPGQTIFDYDGFGRNTSEITMICE